jgi:Papain family cysteine protease
LFLFQAVSESASGYDGATRPAIPSASPSASPIAREVFSFSPVSPFRLRRLSALLLLSGIYHLGAADAPASDTSPTGINLVGHALGTIRVGQVTYEDVRIKSWTTRSLVFTHRDGIGSVRLRDLPAAIQAQLGYDASAAPPESRAENPDSFDVLLTAFGTAPELRAKQSLQADYVRFSLGVKSQGHRPSCAIFAIVSALEFQNARMTGAAQKLSEEYLIWATRKMLGQTIEEPSGTSMPNALGNRPEDLGYTLTEVVSALRAYGIPCQYDMPYHPENPIDRILAPNSSVIAEARTRRLVNVCALPGREPAALISNLIHALNHGYPVPVGLSWPRPDSADDATLGDQPTMLNAAHAVTMIGYECASGHIQDTVFIFKNSFGPYWGEAGYGRATWRYLVKNLHEGFVLDVTPAPSS